MRTQTTSRCLIVQGDNIVLCKHLAGGYYFLPGGGLEIGETLNQCITRELNEEMGVAESDITIHDGILLAIENQGYDSNGNFLYGIEVVKRVDINTENITSQEDLIGFEKVKISALPGTKLYPKKIKNRKWKIKICITVHFKEKTDGLFSVLVLYYFVFLQNNK